MIRRQLIWIISKEMCIEFNKSTLRGEWQNRWTLTPVSWVGTLSLTGPAVKHRGRLLSEHACSTNYIQLMGYSNFPTGADGFGRLAICVPFNSIGAFPKQRKATIRFVMSVCPSVHVEQLGSHWTDFQETWYLSTFRKTVETFHVSVKSDTNNGYFAWIAMYIYDISLVSYW